MAYNQAPLNNIGNVREKIAKRKLEKRFGSVDNAKSFAAEQFKSRSEERRLSKNTVTPTETSFTTSIKPFEKETIKFDTSKDEAIKTRRKPESKLSKAVGKVGMGLEYGAVELKEKALDIIPGAGKRRVFVGPNLESGSQDRFFGSDEAGHHKRFRYGGVNSEHFKRMSNKQWRKKKKDKYTLGQRAMNTFTKVSMRGFTGLAGALTGIAVDQAKNQGRGFENFKKAAKKIKNRLSI